MAKKRKPRRKYVADMQEAIDAIQGSLDRLQVAFEQDMDMDAAFGDLMCYVSDLEDIIEKSPEGDRS